MDYTQMSVAELRQAAKELGISGCSSKKKSEIIELITAKNAEEDAKKQAEALITKIGLDCNQYVCRYELDMSLDRIRNMGAIYEQSIVDGSLPMTYLFVP